MVARHWKCQSPYTSDTWFIRHTQYPPAARWAELSISASTAYWLGRPVTRRPRAAIRGASRCQFWAWGAARSTVATRENTPLYLSCETRRIAHCVCCAVGSGGIDATRLQIGVHTNLSINQKSGGVGGRQFECEISQNRLVLRAEQLGGEPEPHCEATARLLCWPQAGHRAKRENQ